jgi:hypothetical protein
LHTAETKGKVDKYNKDIHTDVEKIKKDYPADHLADIQTNGQTDKLKDVQMVDWKETKSRAYRINVHYKISDPNRYVFQQVEKSLHISASKSPILSRN